MQAITYHQSDEVVDDAGADDGVVDACHRRPQSVEVDGVGAGDVAADGAVADGAGEADRADYALEIFSSASSLTAREFHQTS